MGEATSLRITYAAPCKREESAGREREREERERRANLDPAVRVVAQEVDRAGAAHNQLLRHRHPGGESGPVDIATPHGVDVLDFLVGRGRGREAVDIQVDIAVQVGAHPGASLLLLGALAALDPQQRVQRDAASDDHVRPVQAVKHARRQCVECADVARGGVLDPDDC